jgi:hypothetical protein
MMEPEQLQHRLTKRSARQIAAVCLCLASTAVIYFLENRGRGQLERVVDVAGDRDDTLSRLENKRSEILARMKADQSGGSGQSSSPELSGQVAAVSDTAATGQKLRLGDGTRKTCGRLCQTRKALLQAREKIDGNANMELKQIAVSTSLALCCVVSDVCS